MTIPEITQQKDKTPIDSVQGKVIAVGKPRDYRGKPVTNIELSDGGGNKLQVTVWEYTNMEFYKHKEVVISAGARGGVTTRWDDYTKLMGLQVGKSANFQVIESGAPQTPIPSNPSPSVPPANTQTPPAKNYARNGQQVGMAVNNAVALALAQMEAGNAMTDLEGYLKSTASLILRVSDFLESGKLVEKSDNPF